MPEDLPKYRNPENLTDSEEEVHPNIDSKSFHRFRREERRIRLAELREKSELTAEEEREKAVLEYKSLPIAVEASEPEFRVSKEIASADCSDELIWLLENSDVGSLIKLLDSRVVNLDGLEEIIYFNLSEAIKEGDDELGYTLCRLGLLVHWANSYGRSYLLKIRDAGEEQLSDAFVSQYAASKDAIMSLKKE